MSDDLLFPINMSYHIIFPKNCHVSSIEFILLFKKGIKTGAKR